MITATLLATAALAAGGDRVGPGMIHWRGPVIAPGRVARVPSRARLCDGFPRDVYATRRGRELPERTLRRVHRKPNKFRNVSERHVRVEARCLLAFTGSLGRA